MPDMSFEEFQVLSFSAALRRRRPAFFKDAACSSPDVDASLFFPKQGQSSLVREARLICFECPVQYECLSYAVNEKIEDGVWGGSTAADRRVWIKNGFSPEEAWDNLSFFEE